VEKHTSHPSTPTGFDVVIIGVRVLVGDIEAIENKDLGFTSACIRKTMTDARSGGLVRSVYTQSKFI
jgi:hypothetical protein